MNQPEGQGEQFDKLWDETLLKLEANNQAIFDVVPVSVRNFIENRMLLDHPVFCRSSDFQTDEYSFVIGSPNTKEILFLSYRLNDELQIDSQQGAGFDLNAPAAWLYDEFHVVDGKFQHHVIFSDGISYVIPFDNFFCRVTKWFEEDQNG